MSDNRKEYPRRLSIQVTEAMDDRLEQIARSRDEAKSEVVRAALRVFLDEQEDVIGSRKHFTKAFGRRMEHLERVVAAGLWIELQTLHLLYERLRKEPLELTDLLEDAVREGITLQAMLAELVELLVQRKTKPPA
jgi:predicted transcriptional regulator